VLIVDDSSPDGTGDVADRLAAELPEVSVLHRTVKEGLGRAYLAGFEHAVAAGAELVGVMDADFSHDPAHLPALLEAAASSDIVLGSRYVDGGRIVDWPPLRRLLSRGGSLYARSLLGVHVRDLTGGFKIIRREVLEAIEPGTLRSQGYVFNIELTYRAIVLGFTVTEIPIVFRDRTEGRSKMSLPVAIEALWLVPRLRRSARLVEADSQPAEETAPA
jgi:dolichol-phosphate mannosyltransferase